MSFLRKNPIGNKKGFTLIEVIVVITIMSILSAIVVPKFVGYTEKAKKEVCKVNCLQLERMYDVYLIMEGKDHSEALFTQFLDEYGKDICYDHGEVVYVEGKVQCSKHDLNVVDESDDEEDNSVPFL